MCSSDLIGNLQVAEGDVLELPLVAIDTDGDPLTWSAANLPPGARLDATTGVLSFAPGYFMAGVYGGIVISVSDGATTVSENIAIEVLNTNRAPILAGLAPLGTQENRLLQFSLVGDDQDQDAIVYSLARYTRDGVAQQGTRPTGVFFDAQKGRFEWTPGYEQSGEYVFTFRASDRYGATDTLDVVVRVADVNRAPVITLENRQTSLGEPLVFTIGGTDPDSGETLLFSAEGLPEGATLDAATGAFAWTPGPGQAGEYLVMVTLSDGKTSTVRPLLLRATLTPQQPTAVIELTPGFATVPGQTVAITVIAQSYSAIVSRTLVLDGQAIALDAQNRATIPAPDAGIHVLTATVTDRDGLVTTVERLLRVRDPADTTAPVVGFDIALSGAALTGITPIGAGVADTNLEEWRQIGRAHV